MAGPKTTLGNRCCAVVQLGNAMRWQSVIEHQVTMTLLCSHWWIHCSCCQNLQDTAHSEHARQGGSFHRQPNTTRCDMTISR